MSFIDPATWSKPWTLSKEEGKAPVSIPNNVLKHFGKQDIIVVDFLYRSYIKQLNGVVLNEEEDLNPQLQVSSFLGTLYNSLKDKFLVLVLCPDHLITKWHYYMTKFGNLDVKIINSRSVPEDFDQESGLVLLLSFTNIKLAEYLKEYDIFSVVIDAFDQVTSKLAIRKLQGHFNIGVTSRNFYVTPDQKIKWTMLNWTNPGCVGKLSDFYEIDRDNLAGVRNNYKEWWFRLTWDFCDSFVKPTLEEKGKLNIMLRDWATTHHLIRPIQLKSKTTRKKKGEANVEGEKEHVDSEDNKQNKRETKNYKKKAGPARSPKKIIYKSTPRERNNKNKRDFRNLIFSSDSSNSSDTIIYDNDSYQQLDDNEAMGISENDEPPIGGLLNSKELPIDDLMEKNQVKKSGSLENLQEEKNDEAMDDNESVSSGEQLLCSLVGHKNRNFPRSTKTVVRNVQNDLSENSDDESDLYLKSVASTSSDVSPLKKRKNAEAFFNRILEKTDKRPAFNALTRMEMELTEKEVLDVPSESDNFFKDIFNKQKSNSNLSDNVETKEKDHCNQESDSFLKGILNDTGRTKNIDSDRGEETDIEYCSQSSNVSFSNGCMEVDT